jgi:hypothetical protein
MFLRRRDQQVAWIPESRPRQPASQRPATASRRGGSLRSGNPTGGNCGAAMENDKALFSASGTSRAGAKFQTHTKDMQMNRMTITTLFAVLLLPAAFLAGCASEEPDPAHENNAVPSEIDTRVAPLPDRPLVPANPTNDPDGQTTPET